MRNGLYYPFIHIQDDDWLKLAALTFDRVARIVPDRLYRKRDTELARTLIDRCGFITDCFPNRQVVDAVAADYFGMLADRAEELDQYRLSRRDQWPEDAHTALMSQRIKRDNRLAYVHVRKMARSLVPALGDYGLAEGSPAGDWIGMAPPLADGYMIALARRVCDLQLGPDFGPVTDRIMDHVGAAACGTQELGDGLTAKTDLVASAEDSARVVAMASIRSVIPDLRRLDAKSLVKIRKDTAAARANYQMQVREVVKTVGFGGGFKDFDEMEQALTHLHETRIAPALRVLEADYAASKLTVRASVVGIASEVKPGGSVVAAAIGGGVGTLLGPGGTALGAAIGGALGGGASVVVSYLSVRDRAREKQQAVMAHPLAYLLQLQHLNPRSLDRALTRDVRRFNISGHLRQLPQNRARSRN